MVANHLYLGWRIGVNLQGEDLGGNHPTIFRMEGLGGSQPIILRMAGLGGC